MESVARDQDEISWMSNLVSEFRVPILLFIMKRFYNVFDSSKTIFENDVREQDSAHPPGMSDNPRIGQVDPNIQLHHCFKTWFFRRRRSDNKCLVPIFDFIATHFLFVLESYKFSIFVFVLACPVILTTFRCSQQSRWVGTTRTQTTGNDAIRSANKSMTASALGDFLWSLS